MSSMFCFQCQQTLNNAHCDRNKGACGKTSAVATLQDKLIGKTIALANASQPQRNDQIDKLILDALFVTITNVNFSESSVLSWCDRIDLARQQFACSPEVDLQTWWEDDDEDRRSVKSLILFGIKGVAAYACHAIHLGYHDQEITQSIVDILCLLSHPQTMEALLNAALEVGNINLRCMALLDKAHTETYGIPTPTTITTEVEAGPFIVVTGHDLHDLYLLLQQTQHKGINIYTHGEMLPAHGYPKLREFSHLKGHFGGAWQNQQIEFAHLPAPIVYTTNCLMPVQRSYHDRVYTTSVVDYDGMQHIDETKDFSPVIEKAIALGGYPQSIQPIHSKSHQLQTGFSHGFIVSVADQVLDAVKKGNISHFYLVGGCDGAQMGRNYYTDFVEQTPKDSLILTLGCGKFRINHLQLGNIGPFPRLMDMGQCNDAYGAIQVAIALANALGCGVNQLPLSLVLSWYEQKAVCVLLTLLALGIKNIFVGPTLPAFLSPNVVNILIEQWGLHLTSTPEEDLALIKQLSA